MDYYSVLGINKNASQEEVRKAYKKKSMQHHPDRGGDEEEFKRVNEAYQTLGDEQKRRMYDNPQPRYNSSHFAHANGFEDVFAQFFGGRQRGGPRPQIKNPDVNIIADITIEELFTGKNLFLTYSLQNGQQQRIEINIPKGIEDGQMIRYTGLGDDSIKDLPRGDLFVKIRVRNTKHWRRDGINLHTEKDLNIFDLMIGTEVEIDTPEDKSLVLKIPSGTQPGTTFSIHGYGIPDMKRGKRGVIYVKIKGTVPKITDATILKELEKIKNATSQSTK